jgi:hypothetical protein
MILQERLLRELNRHPDIATDRDRLGRVAIGTHARAYIEGGMLDVNPKDMLLSVLPAIGADGMGLDQPWSVDIYREMAKFAVIYGLRWIGRPSSEYWTASSSQVMAIARMEQVREQELDLELDSEISPGLFNASLNFYYEFYLPGERCC